MVTLKDIAEKLNVTIATVSYALNNDKRISEEKRRLILETAHEMGYSGKSGKVKNKGVTKQIVLCLNSITGDIFPDVVETINETLELAHCCLTIYVGKDISKLQWFDGLIVLNSRLSSEEIAKITSKKIPAILMDREEKLYNATCITLDNFDGCYQTTKCAVTAGAKSFAFVGGPKESFESKVRYEGFVKALHDNSLDKISAVVQTDFTFDGGQNALGYLVERDSVPDAIVCANDETAFGVIAGLKNAKISKDVIITGFDGVRKYSQSNRFATAKADHKHWATVASYALLSLLDRTPVRDIKIPVHLVEYNM